MDLGEGAGSIHQDTARQVVVNTDKKLDVRGSTEIIFEGGLPKLTGYTVDDICIAFRKLDTISENGGAVASSSRVP